MNNRLSPSIDFHVRLSCVIGHWISFSSVTRLLYQTFANICLYVIFYDWIGLDWIQFDPFPTSFRPRITQPRLCTNLRSNVQLFLQPPCNHLHPLVPCSLSLFLSFSRSLVRIPTGAKRVTARSAREGGRAFITYRQTHRLHVMPEGSTVPTRLNKSFPLYSTAWKIPGQLLIRRIVASGRTIFHGTCGSGIVMQAHASLLLLSRFWPYFQKQMPSQTATIFSMCKDRTRISKDFLSKYSSSFENFLPDVPSFSRQNNRCRVCTNVDVVLPTVLCNLIRKLLRGVVRRFFF